MSCLEESPGLASPARAVLVVDDDDAIREAILDLLAAEGVPAVSARNGFEALEYLQGAATAPGLILLDLRMPLMSGETVMSEIRRQPKLASVPVAIVSAEPEANAIGKRICADYVLKKPFDLDRLYEIVARHVR